MPSGSFASTGTVTFLFTDIVGSTERWQADAASMAIDLARHDEVLRRSIARHGGDLFKHTGDGVVAVFASTDSAVSAAAAAQRELSIGVRMGVHAGEAEARDGDYFGPTLNRAARVMDAGQAGQVLLSAAAAALVTVHEVRDLGLYQLKGLSSPERIFQLGSETFPPLRAPLHGAGNLPTDLTSFVGREAELAAVTDHLAAHRLVTLIGVGGTGKTRLAIEAASMARPHVRDGIWLVELAAVYTGEAVATSVADAVRVAISPGADVMDELITGIGHRELLIVMDNCEHVLDAAGDVVEALLSGCPRVRVLATSREPLMLRGEQLYPVPSLGPAEAQQLFITRLRSEAPDTVLDDRQLAAISELCRRLDGLPLALELAASRGRALSPLEITARLDERFRLLVGGRRGRMERQQTMRGTLDWSYDMLPPIEQQVFDRLSVFAATFDTDAAIAVAAFDGISGDDVRDVLAGLLDRSLIQRTTMNGLSRYRLLETMRAYGREHLLHKGELAAVRERHARNTALTGGRLQLTPSLDLDGTTSRLEALRPDALVALDWCIEHSEWDLGLAAATVSVNSSEREMGDSVSRLRRAAIEGGAAPHLLAELARWDASVPVAPTVDRLAAAWVAMRDEPVPEHRLTLPPMNQFLNGGLEARDVEHFIELSRRWTSVGGMSALNSYFVVTRALIYNHHVDAAATQLEEMRLLADQIDDAHEARGVDELTGLLAKVRGDWDRAALYYGRAAQGTNDTMSTWFDLVVAWHHLAARANATAKFECNERDLIDPWDCLHSQRLGMLETLGCVSTAVALQRLGHRDLAQRFLARAERTVAGGELHVHFGETIDAAGLSLDALPAVEELDVLVADLTVWAASADAPLAHLR